MSLKSPTFAGIWMFVSLPGEPVERRRGHKLQSRLAGAVQSHAIDDVDTPAPLLDHGCHDFRRVLKIGIDDDHAVATSVVDARGDRDLVAEVARELQHSDVSILRREACELFIGAVPAAVVNKDEFVGRSLEERQRACRPFVECTDDRLLVENRDHQRHLWLLAWETIRGHRSSPSWRSNARSVRLLHADGRRVEHDLGRRGRLVQDRRFFVKFWIPPLEPRL